MKRRYEKILMKKSSSGKTDCSRLVDNFPKLPLESREIIATMQHNRNNPKAVKEILKQHNDFAELIIVLLNTRFFNLPKPVNSTRQALQNPGPGKILELALLLSLIDPLYEAKDADDLQSFWKHSFGCGYIGRFIGEKIALADPGKIFIAGLFHDLGKLVLNQNFPIDFLKVINYIKEKRVSFYEAEKAVIGITHCDIGAEVAQKWELGDEITEVLQHHHAISLATKNRVLVMLINLTNLIVRTHHAGFELLENLPVSLEELTEQKSWKILLEQNTNHPKIDLENFFDEIEHKLDQLNFLIEDIFEIIK